MESSEKSVGFKYPQTPGMIVRIGSDVAFAMLEGTLSSPKHTAWIGRVRKFYRGKNLWRHEVSLSDGLPHDMFMICEWYSPIKGTGDLQYHFKVERDRARYSFEHFIGLVRIDLDDSGSSSSSGGGRCKDKYIVSPEQLTLLHEALLMTTPVSRGSKMTLAEQKKRKQQQEKESEDAAARTLKPRLNFRGAGGRDGTGGAAAAAMADQEEGAA